MTVAEAHAGEGEDLVCRKLGQYRHFSFTAWPFIGTLWFLNEVHPGGWFVMSSIWSGMWRGNWEEGSQPINVYSVRFDGLFGTGTGAIVAENAENAYESLMAELRERILPQSGPRIEEIKRLLAAGPVDLKMSEVYLFDRGDY